MGERENSITFEESLKKLEQMAQEMESGKLSLEDALDKYEEGAKLFKLCKDKINKAEKRIMKIKDSIKEEV
jgi:exodeoxyribonuclease VII small subunit